MSNIHTGASPTLELLPQGCVIDGKYRIDELIAKGGMGLVYAATHRGLDQRVAIKVVRPDLADDAEVIRRFLNEARSVARLKSAHVAHVLDSGTIADGRPYLVMEYLEGVDLCALLWHNGPLPIDVAVDYVVQACAAAAEAHALGIVHRDLKPENLFLTCSVDGSTLIKVLDFGISKVGGTDARTTNPRSGIGSPSYMSPEQMHAPSQVDGRADIWSLGTILYELLAGNAPFDGDSVPNVCARVLGDEPRPLRELRPDVPADLEAAISRCLRKDREERFANVAELAGTLAPFGSAASTPIAARAKRTLLPGHAVCSVRIIESSSEDFTPAPHITRVTTKRPAARRGRAVAVTLSAVAVGAMIGSVHFGDLQRALSKTALGGSATAMLSWRAPVHSRLDSSASAVRSSVQKAASLAHEPPAIRAPVPAPSIVGADPAPQQPDTAVPSPKPRKIRHESPRTDDESATIPAASSRSSDAPEETAAAVRDTPYPAAGER